MSVEAVVYKEPPARLLALLKKHVPHSLPLLRRLQFTRFPGGITEHSHILWASDAELDGGGGGGDGDDDLPASTRFTAGYLDFSRGKR